MAGEIVKTQGIVLAVYPWSQTSHVVTWLTPDHGPVTTLVKGAVRAKSAFVTSTPCVRSRRVTCANACAVTGAPPPSPAMPLTS